MTITLSGIAFLAVALLFIWGVYWIVTRMNPLDGPSKINQVAWFVASIATLAAVLCWFLSCFGIASPIHLTK